MAARCGADMVELDVQLSRDRQLVVVHDDSLERCSDVSRQFPGRAPYDVRSFTLAEIQSLDAGGWFVRALARAPAPRPEFLRSVQAEEIKRFITPAERAHYASGAVRHPTLRQALTRAHELGLAVNVELKGSPDVPADLVDRVVGLIDELGLTDRVLLSSFDHASLVRVKERRQSIATGVLVAEPIADPGSYCRSSIRADAYHPGCLGEHDAVGFSTEEYRRSGRLPPDPIRSLRAAGIAVNVWTENDPVRMRQLIEAGVSGIVTDYPNRVVEALSVQR